MTLLGGHDLVHTGSWPFRHRMDELEMAGVQLAHEQTELFNRCANQWPPAQESDFYYALTPWVPDDPFERYHRFPLSVWGEGPRGWTKSLLVLPRVVRIDWQLAEDLDKFDPVWRRLPALPGHLLEAEGDTEDPEAFRLWNLWPLAHNDVEVVQDLVRGLVYDWSLDLYRGMAMFWTGELDPCDEHYDSECVDPDTGQEYTVDDLIAQGYGRPCQRSDEMEAAWAEEFLVPQDAPYGVEGILDPRCRGDLSLPWPLNETFETLRSFAARNSHCAQALLPEHQQRDETRYSPWLWSS